MRAKFEHWRKFAKLAITLLNAHLAQLDRATDF